MINMKNRISLIIPAYDEEKTLQTIINSVKKYVNEVIVVVAKKSKDNTFLIASKTADKCIKDNGKGKGAALKLGVSNASNDIIVFMDADGSHDSKDIPKLLRPIFKDDFDLVIGSRIRGGSDEMLGDTGEYFRNIGGQFIMVCINLYFGVNFTDCENGFRAIKKQVFTSLDLKANDFDIEQEMFIKALKKNFKVKEVPAHEYRRKFGKSKLNLFKIGWKFMWRLIISFIN